MRGVDALRCASGYSHPPLGYVGNLRRFSPLPGSATRRVTAPAGFCVRARDAFWKLLIAVMPGKSLRAEHAQRDRVRTLGLACGNLLGTLTIERGKDRQNQGVAALRKAVVAMEQCQAVSGRDDEMLKAVLQRHLARLSQDDLLDIENGQEIDVDEKSWPNPEQRKLASIIMRLIVQLHAEATTVPSMVRKLEDLATSISPLSNRPRDGRFIEKLSALPENKRISDSMAIRLALAKIPSWHWNRLHDALFRNPGDSGTEYAFAKLSGSTDRTLDCLRKAIACESARREAPSMVLELREKHPGVFSREYQAHGLAMAQWLDELLRKDAPGGAEARESDEAKMDRIAPVLNEQLALLGSSAMAMAVRRLDANTLRRMLDYRPGEAVTKMVKVELDSRKRNLTWIDSLPIYVGLQPLQLLDLLVMGQKFRGKIPFGNITPSNADQLDDEEWVHQIVRLALESTLGTMLPDQLGEVEMLSLDGKAVSDDLLAVLMRGREALPAYGISLDADWVKSEVTRRVERTREFLESSLSEQLLRIHEDDPPFHQMLPKWQEISAAMQRYFYLNEAQGAQVTGDARKDMMNSLVKAAFKGLGSDWSDRGRETSNHVHRLHQAAVDWASEFSEYPFDDRDLSRARALGGVRMWEEFLWNLLHHIEVNPVPRRGNEIPELAQWCREIFPA